MVTEKTVEQRVKDMEDAMSTMADLIESLTKKLTTVEKTAVTKPKGLFGNKRTKTATKDTTTGVVYPSKSAVGKALYTEIEDGDPADRFIWYKLLSKFPDRFVELGEDSPEAKKVWADEKAQIEAEVAEANKKLQAEEAKKAQPAPQAPAQPKKR